MNIGEAIVMDISKLISEMLWVGADAADYIDPCTKCGAPSGKPCVNTTDGARRHRKHEMRLSGDVTLAFTLRAMARYVEQNSGRIGP